MMGTSLVLGKLEDARALRNVNGADRPYALLRPNELSYPAHVVNAWA